MEVTPSLEVTPKQGRRGRYGIWYRKQKFGAREMREGTENQEHIGKEVISVNFSK